MKPFPLGALASPSPAPDQVKDSLRTLLFNKVLDVCDGLGLSREAAGRIWLIVIWSPFPLFVLMAGWLWRRSRREPSQ
jgi:hypothetical protein